MKKKTQIRKKKPVVKRPGLLGPGSVTITLPRVPMPKGVKRTMKIGKELHNPWNETSVFFWCLHCERTYRRGECRVINGLQMCPHEGCDGDTFMDGWPWEKIRTENPQYPVIPLEGERYPLYPEPAKSKKARK